MAEHRVHRRVTIHTVGGAFIQGAGTSIGSILSLRFRWYVSGDS